MSEHAVMARTRSPITTTTLVADLVACGLRTGQTILVHTRMSALGWVVGGAQAVIQALLKTDFATLGAAYEAAHQLAPAAVGQAPTRFLRQRPLVDWAVSWIERHHR